MFPDFKSVYNRPDLDVGKIMESSKPKQLRKKLASAIENSPTGRKSDPLRAVTRIGFRNLREAFTRKTTALPGRLSELQAPDARLAVLWAGQSTCLIQIAGSFVLTDPNFSPTIGALVKRLVDVGLEPSQLPGLSAVVISHAHMDHLDLPSLAALPRTDCLLLPSGLSPYIRSVKRKGGYARILELPHWESREYDGVRITSVPAVHEGSRYGLDELWRKPWASGYVIEKESLCVYYSGDTAYDPELFRRIGSRFRIHAALIPIGPLEPRWLMRQFHADPQDSLRIFEDCKADHMIPVHYNTFIQSLEHETAAIREFQGILRNNAVRERIHVLRQGEQAVFDTDQEAVSLREIRSPYPEGFDDPRIPGPA